MWAVTQSLWAGLPFWVAVIFKGIGDYMYENGLGQE